MLEFKDVSVTVGQRKILDGITFSLPTGQITAVIGRNGSGKSTLLSCVTGKSRYCGEILLDGVRLCDISCKERAKRISVLPQNLPKAHMTVGELASMGRMPYLGITKSLTEADKQAVTAALYETDLSDFTERRVASLSGGECQMAYLAMILAQNTDILFLDEPTTYMDIDNEAKFLSLVASLKEKHRKTVLIVMHNLSKAMEISDNVLVLDNGSMRFFGTASECADGDIVERTFGICKSRCMVDGTQRVIYYR